MTVTITRSTRILADWTHEQTQETTHIPYGGDVTTYTANWSSDEPGGEIYTPRTLLEAMKAHPAAYWRMWVKVNGEYQQVLIEEKALVHLAEYRWEDEITAYPA